MRAGVERRAVVGALPATDGDLVTLEVDVLHAQREGLLEAQAGAVEELAEEAEGRREPVEQGEDVAAREDVGEVGGALGAFEALERGQLHLEHLAVEEDQGAERLVLRRSRGVTPDREVVEEGRDLGGAHLARVTTLVKADEVAHPAEVRLVGAQRIVESAEGGRDGFEEGHDGAPGGAGKDAARRVVGSTAGRLRRISEGAEKWTPEEAERDGWGAGRGWITRAIWGYAAGGRAEKGSGGGGITRVILGYGAGGPPNEMLGGHRATSDGPRDRRRRATDDGLRAMSNGLRMTNRELRWVQSVGWPRPAMRKHMKTSLEVEEFPDRTAPDAPEFELEPQQRVQRLHLPRNRRNQ